MNLFAVFQTVLYTVSTALLYPVVLALILLSVWMIVYVGGFAAEWIKRKRFAGRHGVAHAMDRIHDLGSLPDDVKRAVPFHIVEYAGQLTGLLQGSEKFMDEQIENLNQAKTGTLQKEVDKIRLVVRTGPSLGLMGTLIPMGTGLAGLTQGNMAQLSSSLILAFTTTVVGLALGIGAHFFSTVKEQWMLEDLRSINLITEALARPQNKTVKKEKAA